LILQECKNNQEIKLRTSDVVIYKVTITIGFISLWMISWKA